MTIVRWTPAAYRPSFDAFRRFATGLAPAFNPLQGGTAWRPHVDVAEDENGWTLEMDLPGVPREKVKVTAENGVLTIEGEATRDESASAVWSERPGGNFRRRFTLPDTVDTASVTAEHRDGVLKVTLPKSEASKRREIEVSVS